MILLPCANLPRHTQFIGTPQIDGVDVYSGLGPWRNIDTIWIRRVVAQSEGKGMLFHPYRVFSFATFDRQVLDKEYFDFNQLHFLRQNEKLYTTNSFLSIKVLFRHIQLKPAFCVWGTLSHPPVWNVELWSHRGTMTNVP